MLYGEFAIFILASANHIPTAYIVLFFFRHVLFSPWEFTCCHFKIPIPSHFCAEVDYYCTSRKANRGYYHPCPGGNRQTRIIRCASDALCHPKKAKANQNNSCLAATQLHEGTTRHILRIYHYNEKHPHLKRGTLIGVLYCRPDKIIGTSQLRRQSHLARFRYSDSGDSVTLRACDLNRKWDLPAVSTPYGPLYTENSPKTFCYHYESGASYSVLTLWYARLIWIMFSGLIEAPRHPM